MPTGEAFRKVLETIKTALFTLGAVFLTCFVAWAAGITVPEGSRLDINSGELHLETDPGDPGSVRNYGVISTTTGKIYLNGDWTIYGSGYYEANAGTVIFSAAAAATQVITPGTVPADAFFDLDHTGAGDLRLSTNTIKVRGDLSNLDGTLYGQGIDMQIYGDWINTAPSVPADLSFYHGNNAVNLVGADQSIYGETTFYDLDKHLSSAAGATLTLPALAEQTVENSLTLTGYVASTTRLALRSSSLTGDQAFLTLLSGGIQNIHTVSVKDNNASGGVTLVARGDSLDEGNNINWLFGAVELTWDGSSVDGDWRDPFNWNLGIVPESGDRVIIPAGTPNEPILTADVALAGLRIMAGATVTLDTFDLTLSGAVPGPWGDPFVNAGTIILDGSEVVTAPSLTDTGTFRYIGQSNGSEHYILDNFVINGAPLAVFNALVIEDPGADPDTFRISSALRPAETFTLTVTTDATFTDGTVVIAAGRTLAVNGTMTINGAGVTVNAEAGSLNLNDFVLSSGSFSAPDGILPFTVSGDFTRTGGAFDPNEGTVTFDGVDQSIYTGAIGSVAFYGLSKQATGPDTLTFEAGDTFLVAHQLTLRGLDQDTLLNIDSSIYNSSAFLNLATGGIQNIRDVYVVDNNADGGLLLVAQGVNSNGIRTSNWLFGSVAADLIWDGTPAPLSLSHTAWDEPSNWDLGFVPRNGIDRVVIPVIPGQPLDQPHLTAGSGDVNVLALTLQVDASLYADGHGLAVTGAFSNDGRVYLYGNEVLSLTQDWDSGAFVYWGNGAGPVPPVALAIPNTFFDLRFQAPLAGTASAFASSVDMMIYGTLTVSGASFDAGAHSLDLGDSVIPTGGHFVMTGGSFKAPDIDHDFNIMGNFTQTTAAGFDANGGTVTLDATSLLGATDQVISGTTTFSGLYKRIPAGIQIHQLTLDSTGEQIVTRSLDLGGIMGNPLQIASTIPATRADLQLRPAGLQQIQYMIVVDSNAYGSAPLPPDPTHAVTLVARNSDGNPPSLNYLNWIFGAADVVWTGAFNTDWHDPRNWDLGLAPIAGDSVVIPHLANQPHLTLTSGAIDLNDLTIENDASIYLDGYGMTVSGNFSNEGHVVLYGTEPVRVVAPDIDTGAFQYIGNDLGIPIDLTIYDLAGVPHAQPTYFDLEIADGGSVADTFHPAVDLNIYGSLTVSGGILDASDRALELGGSMIFSGGTLLAPDTGVNPAYTFVVEGGWTYTSGTFTPGTGTVTLSGPNDVTVSGNTTFYDLTVLDPDAAVRMAARTVEFQQGSDQTITHTLDMLGDETYRLKLRSTDTAADPADWTLTVESGSPIVNNLDVADSHAVFPAGNPATRRYILALNSTDASHVDSNINWVFANLDIIAPFEGTTADRVPTVIGRGIPGELLTLLDRSDAVIATTIVDANGNFRVVVGQDDADLGVPIKAALDVPSGTTDDIVPVFDGYRGNMSTFTVLDTAGPELVPVITFPANEARLGAPNPTILGYAQVGAEVLVVAYNPSGGMLLTLPPETYIGQGTVSVVPVDGQIYGSFSVPLAPLGGGYNYVSVIVNGVSSPIVAYVVNNIRGVVFDPVTNAPIEGASVSIYNSDGTLSVPGVDLSDLDVNPFVTGADGRYYFLLMSASYYIRVQAVGYDYPTRLSNSEMPVGRMVIAGSRGEEFTALGIMEADQPMDANASIFRVEKKANKAEARIGEVVTYTVTIENLLESNTVSTAKLVDVIPPGFKYMKGRSQVDGVPIAEPVGNRPVWFDTGDFAPRQIKTLRYQLVIGSGVGPGAYENVATMRYPNNSILSNRAIATVKIVLDPLFDAGTIFGKVFYDWNENGRQDGPEYVAEDREEIIEGAVPNVKLVMEDGTLVTADVNGQFHIPALLPGRHLLRLDERSLPPGAYLTTDKVQVIDVTPGSIFKVNFGVNMDNTQVVGKDAEFFQREFAIDQAITPPKPRLNVDVFNENILLHNDTVIEQIEFRIFTNYTPFLMSWQLDVIDADTKKVVRAFKGKGSNIYDPIYWDGRDSSGKYLRADIRYAYALKVQDENGKWDETAEQALSVRTMTDQEMTERQRQRSDKEKTDEASARAKKYRLFLVALAQGNVLKTQNIWVKGDTIVLRPTSADVRQVRVLKNGELFTEIPVLERNGLTAGELLEGQTEEQSASMEIILPDGDYELEVVSAQRGEGLAGMVPVSGGAALSSSGAVANIIESLPVQTARYKKVLKVGEDYMMFVAMGDGKIGYNMNRGNIEPVQSNEKFQPGFYTEGKLAYYLKGKIKGKYLVTSSLDTDRQRKEALRTFRSEEYYPVYGDSSTVNYDATSTEGPLYLAVDWDKSQAIWGNYAVAFNGVEFANYTRSLYGGKLDYKSVATTDHGEPKTNIVVFHAEVRQRSAHNEFLGTGGSLYYFKHQDIVEGSDSIKLEVRDSVTGLVKSTTEMTRGVDYEIDRGNGRVLFWRPVSMSTESSRLISNSLLSGDPVYVVANYEYFVHDKITEGTQGVRVAQAVGKNVIVGGTYVSETQANRDYELKGQDVTVHLGKDATVQAEYAETTSGAQNNYISTNGGISFTELASADNASGRAYGIKQDARLFDRVGLKSYYKWIGEDFSTGGTTSQQGKELTGLALTFDLTPVTRLTASRDIQRLIERGNLQSAMQVGARETTTTFLQVVHDARRLRLKEEFQSVEVRGDAGVTTQKTNALSAAAQAEYALDEKTDLLLRHEAALSGITTQATTVGVSRQVTDKLAMALEETFSTEGTATKIGATANVTPKLAVNTDFTLAQVRTGETTQMVALGGRGQINDNTSLETTTTVTQTSAGVDEKTTAIGLTSKVDADTNVRLGVETTQAADLAKGRQALVVEGTKTGLEGRQTTTGVKIEDRAVEGKTTVITAGEQGQLTPLMQLASERSFAFGPAGQDQADTYKIARTKDGRTVETSYARKFADTQTSRSDSNIFALSGDVNDRVAVLASLEKGRAMDLDGSIYNRIAFAGGVGYVQKDPETGEVMFQSSTKAEARFDEGVTDRDQYVFYQSAEGKINAQTTVRGKFSYSVTRNMETKKAEAGYKEIMLGAAYRPVAMDRINIFGQYTYKENQGPAGQITATDVEQAKMHVLSVGAAYDLNDKWELIEKLAMRIMEEKVTGFEFAKTHTWLLVNRANYRLDKDWKIGAEYRILTVQEAKDQKRGLLVEAVRSVSDNVELGIGYNFTNFVDDLTDLGYTVQGPFIRMTGKLYDQSPEERARARVKWLEHRVEIYAKRMLKKEVEDPNSKIMVELNRLYQAARTAQQHGKYEESRESYKNIITITQMMYEEAAQFVRQHIAYEENIYDAYQRAQEYYDKGEFWQARKLWEKIVEEASKAVLE